LILLPENYGIPKSAIERTYLATTDKSWTAKTESPDSIIEEVSAKDPWVGMQLRLMKAFGLRIREAILMRVSYSNAESVLIVEEGTKGGRTRVVPVRNEEQRSVLQDATELAKKSDRGALIPPGKNLSQTLNRAYFICRKFGIFKGGTGMTPHGLRFEYANDRYEEVSGMPTSVRGKPDVYDREADAKARSTVC
jgi:integrase